MPLRANICFSLLDSITMGFQNLSLGNNSVSFYQMCKLLVAPCTVIIQRVFFGERLPSPAVSMALAILLVRRPPLRFFCCYAQLRVRLASEKYLDENNPRRLDKPLPELKCLWSWVCVSTFLRLYSTGGIGAATVTDVQLSPLGSFFGREGGRAGGGEWGGNCRTLCFHRTLVFCRTLVMYPPFFAGS